MMIIQKIVPEGLYESKQQCPYCHLRLWTETSFDEQHRKYYILVCHCCGFIKESKLQGGSDGHKF